MASQALLPKEAVAAASVLVQPGGSGTAGSDVRSALLLSDLGTAGGHWAPGPGQEAQQPLLGQSLFGSQLHPPPHHDHHSAGWHAHAHAGEGQQAAGPRVGVPPLKASGIFASAELADAAAAAPAANGQGNGDTAPAAHTHRQHYQQQHHQGLVGPLGLPTDAAERVALSQLLLQVGGCEVLVLDWAGNTKLESTALQYFYMRQPAKHYTLLQYYECATISYLFAEHL